MPRQRRLTAQEQTRLTEVVSKHLPEYGDRLSHQPPEQWTSALRTRVRDDAVGRELVEAGFDANYAPTPRGLLLEGLIDYLAPWHYE